MEQRVKLIGYVEVYTPKDGKRYYNFWPKLAQPYKGLPWQPWPEKYSRPLILTGENYSCARVELTNNEVICVTFLNSTPVKLDSTKILAEWFAGTTKLYFLDFEAEESIYPASQEGFLPVLSSSAPVSQGVLAVREHITLDVNSKDETPKIPAAGKARQKGPAYVDCDAVVQIGDCFYSFSTLEVGDTQSTFTVSSKTLPRHLKNGAQLWDIFESPEGYVFPRYVFESDLEPVSAPAEEEAPPADDPPAEEPSLLADQGPAQENDAPAVEAPAEETAVPAQEEAAPQKKSAPAAPETVEMGPEDLARYLCESVQAYRPNYQRNDILSIAINLTQNFLTVFPGKPGTGKTSICNIFAQVLGLREADRYVPVQVERGWTSKRDLIGYYNPLSNDEQSDGIIKANLRLYRGLASQWEEAPLLVLLDEANLSPMEYYWSDFIGIAGGDEDEVDRDISLGGDGDQGRLTISPVCRFFATINNDHTTAELSPRIIDRAAVVTLPDGGDCPDKPRRLTRKDHHSLIAWNSLQNAFGVTGEDLDQAEEAMLQDFAASPAGALYQQIKEMLTGKILRVGVSYRAEKAVQRFWSAARRPGVFQGDAEAQRLKDGQPIHSEKQRVQEQRERDIAALDYAVAQRLLPKLAGSGEQFLAQLQQLCSLCREQHLAQCARLLEQIMEQGDQGDAALSYYSFF